MIRVSSLPPYTPFISSSKPELAYSSPVPPLAGLCFPDNFSRMPPNPYVLTLKLAHPPPVWTLACSVQMAVTFPAAISTPTSPPSACQMEFLEGHDSEFLICEFLGPDTGVSAQQALREHIGNKYINELIGWSHVTFHVKTW